MQIDTFGAYVRAELEHWGREFALHRDCDYLGHHSKNLLAVLIEHEGEMPPPNVGYKPLETDARAQLVEDVVYRISRTDNQMACSLRRYYCGLGRSTVARYETALLLMPNAGAPAVRVRAYLALVRRGPARVRGVIEGIVMAA